LQWIGDWELLLADGGPGGPPQAESLPHKWLPWGVAAVLALAAGFFWWNSRRAAPDQPFMELNVDLGPDAEIGQRTTVAISRDGKRIVFPTRQGLATRTIDQSAITQIPGTAGAEDAFFSPDGKSIGFFAESKLKTVALAGGPPVVLCDLPLDRGGSWGDDGNIVFTPNSIPNTTIQKIPSSGGTPSQLIALEPNIHSYRWPQVVPGASTVVFTATTQGGFHDEANVMALSLRDGNRKVIMRRGYFGRFLGNPSGRGYLLYVHQGTMFAAPFDPGRLELLRSPVPVITSVAADSASAGGQFDVSESGTVVYQAGQGSGLRSLAWIDRSGKAVTLATKPEAYWTPRVSPSGKRIAYLLSSAKGTDLWTYDINRETPKQLTFGAGGGGSWLAWTPDEQHIAYGANRAGSQTLWWIRSDGSGQPMPLLESRDLLWPGFFTPDGRTLVYTENAAQILALPLDLTDPERPKVGHPEPLPTAKNASDPALSPDGHWLAYTSAESGPREIFVQPFPGAGPRIRISTQGGRFPVWSRTGHELLFLGAGDHVMAAEYKVEGGRFDAQKPRPWLPSPILRTTIYPSFDIHPDGKRLVAYPRPVPEEGKNLHATFLINFAQELDRRFAASK
jgi:serine/threonine-protein kinase